MVARIQNTRPVTIGFVFKQFNKFFFSFIRTIWQKFRPFCLRLISTTTEEEKKLKQLILFSKLNKNTILFKIQRNTVKNKLIIVNGFSFFFGLVQKPTSCHSNQCVRVLVEIRPLFTLTFKTV